MRRNPRVFAILAAVFAFVVSAAPSSAQNLAIEWLPTEEEAWNASGGSFTIVGELQPTHESVMKGGSFSVTASFGLAEVVTANPVNAAPSVSLLTNQVYVIASSGAIDLLGFATFTPGPASESQQALAGYTLSNNGNALFAVPPAIDYFGTLRFTLAPNVPGSAVVTVVTQDDGGTANGGVDKTTNTFTITVLPTQPNAVPAVASPIPDFAGNEDAPDTSINLRAVFQDTQTPDEGLFFALRVHTNPALVTAALNPATGVLQLHYRPDQHGVATITVRAADAFWLSVEETFVVTVNSVNDAPVITLAPDVVVLEDAGGQTLPSFASFSAGPANESGQTLLGYSVSNSNNSLFAAQPAINGAGVLSFTTAANASGNATVTVTGQDSGGTANGGVDTGTKSFTITVAPLNDAPSVTFATNVVTALLVGTSQTSSNFATFSPGPANESTQALVGYTLANSSNALFIVQPSINNGGTLAFTLAPNANGTAVVAVVVQDNGGTGSGGTDRATNTFTLVAAVQARAITLRYPVLTPSNFTFSIFGFSGLTAIVERAFSPIGPWTNMGSTLLDTNGYAFFMHSNPSVASAFYRAVVVPRNMALIPASSFTMGDALDGDAGALPLHTVHVSAFYMDKFKVTKALWTEVHSWAITHGYSFDNAGQGKAADHPVQRINWYDVVKWCNARSEKEGRLPAYYTSAAQATVYRSGRVNVQNDWVKWNTGYRLPTEAEWEKAARGGAIGRRFPWSDADTIAHSRANYFSDTNFVPYDVSLTFYIHPAFDFGSYPYTNPVGYFAPNGYGLHDMAGNVFEWCWDWHDSYLGASQTDPRGANVGTARVQRGSAFDNYAIYCRTAFRYSEAPDSRWEGTGFRSVLSLGQ